MKKITVDTLSRISSLLPGLSDAEQLDILGGTGSSVSGLSGAYTFDDMLGMIGQGNWTGGDVDGIGYVGEEASTYQTGCYSSDIMLQKMYDGTWTGGWVDHEYVAEDIFISGYYSLSDMEQMRNNGTWEGGWVLGSGYVKAEVNAAPGIYSFTDMLGMIGQGNWMGGNVEGIGYVGEEASAYQTGCYAYEMMLQKMYYGTWTGGWVDHEYVNEESYLSGYFTLPDMERMRSDGTWQGGWVEGSGYVSADLGDVNGVTGAYTYEEMLYMIDTHTWKGGVVEGMGYVETDGVSGHYYSGIYSEEEMVDQMFRNEWHGGWVNGYYREADDIMTGMYTSADEILEAMCQGNWSGGWLENSGYLGSEISGFAGKRVYSSAEMVQMKENGYWEGGWVYEYGFIGTDSDDAGVITGVYTFKGMVDQMFRNEWHGGWVDGEYLGADYVVTGMYRSTDEILEAICYGNWHGGWLENSGYYDSDLTGFGEDTVYSSAEMSAMERSGSWRGGWVYGIGYVTGIVIEGDPGDFGVTGTVPEDAPITGAWYTCDMMEEMIDGGTWTGGFIDGLGYVGEVTTVTGYVAEGGMDIFLDFLKTLCDETVGLVDGQFSDLVYLTTRLGNSCFEGFSYMALDIKYNGWAHCGEGRGKIPTEEVLDLNERTHHAYNFTFSGGLEKVDCDKDGTPEDMVRFISGLTTLLPGTTEVSWGAKEIGKEMVGLAEGELAKRAVLDLIDGNN